MLCGQDRVIGIRLYADEMAGSQFVDMSDASPAIHNVIICPGANQAQTKGDLDTTEPVSTY
jgi:hypothetical protein